MGKNWMTIEIPPGYIGDTPKIYMEGNKILSVFVKLTPDKDETAENIKSKTQNNGSKNRKQSFDYKVERNPDSGGLRFIHQNSKRRENNGKQGSGVGFLIKGFFNVFGSKK